MPPPWRPDPWYDVAEWSAQEWSALGTCTTAVIAVAAAIVASFQVSEARRLRREQTQPYVAVFMETSSVSQHFSDLVVKNFGSTAAYDVHVSFSPELRRSKGHSSSELVKVPGVLRTLVPGQEWRSFLDSGIDRSVSTLPDEYEATVEFFENSDQRPTKRIPIGRRLPKKHTMKYTLDFSSRRGAVFARQYGLHDIGKDIRRIRISLEKQHKRGNRSGRN